MKNKFVQYVERSISVISSTDLQNITYIKAGAFLNCHELINISIPEGVTRIGDGTFIGCTNLRGIVFPASLINFESGSVFQRCVNLSYIMLKSPQIVPFDGSFNNMFYDCPEDFIIYVPENLVEAYKSDEKWGEHAQYILPYTWKTIYELSMNTLADAINTKTNGEGVKTIDELTAIVDENLVDTSSGDATASDILLGKKAWAEGSEITGTIPSKSAQIYTPATTNQVISSGQYLSGNQTILGDPNLVSGNIKSGTSIFGVAGTYSGSQINNLIDRSTVYLNTYSTLWMEYVDHDGSLISLTDRSGNSYSLSWFDTDTVIDINGFHGVHVRRVLRLIVHESGSATRNYDVCYYDDTTTLYGRLFWVTGAKTIMTLSVISSVFYYDDMLKVLFASSEVSYGSYWKDSHSDFNESRVTGIAFEDSYNAGLLGTVYPMVSWLPGIPSNDNKWANIYFNESIDWDSMFEEIDNLLDASTDAFAATLIMSELDDLYPSTFGLVILSLNISGSFVHVFGLLYQNTVASVYSSDDVDIVLPFGSFSYHISATQGWNTSHINFLETFGIAKAYSPYGGEESGIATTIIMKQDSSQSSELIDLLETLSIDSVQEICSEKEISYGKPNFNPSGTLTITSNGEYNIEDLMQYKKIVFANDGIIATPTVSSTHGLTDNQLNFNDAFTYSANNNLNLGVDATVSGDDLTFTE